MPRPSFLFAEAGQPETAEPQLGDMAQKPSSTGPTQRQQRVAELIRHALAEVLQRGDIQDPVLGSHVVTVPEVRMSPDLKLATAYVMPLGGQDEAPVIAALERNRRVLRQEVARRVNLKFAPDLRFLRDETFDEAARIDKLLRDERVRRDLDSDETESDTDH
jgi:ribosome-binding factor A